MPSARLKRHLTIAAIILVFLWYGFTRPLGRIVAPTRWEQDSADGVRFLQEGRLSHAERCLTSALKRAQDDHDAGLRLGTSFQNLGDLRCAQRRFAEAEEYFAKALTALDADPQTSANQTAVLLTSY